MRKTIRNSQFNLTEAIQFILQNLPDPKNHSVSTIKDEVLFNDKKIFYLAQKSKGSDGFKWSIDLV